jgi:hypothetical protein
MLNEGKRIEPLLAFAAGQLDQTIWPFASVEFIEHGLRVARKMISPPAPQLSVPHAPSAPGFSPGDESDAGVCHGLMISHDRATGKVLVQTFAPVHNSSSTTQSFG